MGNKIKFAVASLAMIAVFAAAPVRAFGQTDPRDQIIPSIDLDSADVRDALRQLFNKVNVDYTVDQEVQGQVTVKLTNQTFETVLRNLLAQVGATFRVEGGVYAIVKKNDGAAVTPDDPTTTPPPAATKNPPVRIKIRHADPALIIRLINGDVTPYDQIELSSFASGGQGGGQGGGGFGSGGSGGGFGGGSGGGGFGGGGIGGGGGGGFGGSGGGGGFGGGGRSGF